MTQVATTEKRQNKFRNKFSRKLVQNRKIPGVDVTRRDLAMFEILADPDTKFGPLDYLFALLKDYGTDYQSFSKHVTKLYLNGYVDLPFAQTQTRRADKNYRIIELTEKGRKELRNTVANVPVYKRTGLFEHKNLGCTFNLSTMLYELEDPTFRKINWAAVMAHPSFPANTRKLARPHAVAVSRDQIIVPDDQFMLSYGNNLYRFCVREDDCDTESGWSDFQNTIKFKVWAYLTILANRLYVDHYGVSTFFALFHPNNEERADEILKIIEMTVAQFGFDADLAENILVKHTLVFNTKDGVPSPATGHVMSEPWRRAFDFGDLQLNQP